MFLVLSQWICGAERRIAWHIMLAYKPLITLVCVKERNTIT